MPDSISMHLEFAWIPIEAAPNLLYAWPNAIDRELGSRIKVPAVYRWVVASPSDEVLRMYVGEAANLARRVYGYLRPGPTQQTNLRMNPLLNQEVALGHAVTLEVLSFQSFKLGDVTITQQDLSDKEVRRFLEQLFLVSLGCAGIELLNS